MKNKKKLLTILGAFVAVAAIVATSVAGTVAYLTSSAAVSNVFTVGNVQIVMDETKVDSKGVAVDGGATRVDTNTYHLVPGTKYLKDPQVRVNAGSENSYLFVLVRNDLETIGPKNGTRFLTIAEQMEFLGWREFTAASTGKVYVYCGNSNGNNTLVLPEDGSTEFQAILDARSNPASQTADWTASTTVEDGKYDLFKYFYTDPANTDLSTYGAAKITLTAVAIQASGFSGEVGSQTALNEAWAAVKAAYPYIHTGSN